MNFLGGVCLVLGGIGIFIPVLPTTPFILLAAALFSGNSKVYHWLSTKSCFREYIMNYKEHSGLSKKTVLSSLLFLWGMLMLSAVLVNRPFIYALLFVIGLSVTGHILWVARPGRIKKINNRRPKK